MPRTVSEALSVSTPSAQRPRRLPAARRLTSGRSPLVEAASMPCDRGGSKAMSAVHCEGLHGARANTRWSGCRRGPHVVSTRALHRRLLDALAGVHGTVLDAGCGYRRSARAPPCSASGSAAGPGRGVGRSGVPACRRQVEARRLVRTAPSMHYRSGMPASMPHISADVLCHRAVEPTSALAEEELGRVLRPGGRLVINMPAYMWLAGVRARSPCAQCPPPHRRPAPFPAAGGRLPSAACRLH